MFDRMQYTHSTGNLLNIAFHVLESDLFGHRFREINTLELVTILL